MSTINGKSFQDPRNINLKGGALGSGLIRWNPPQSGAPALWSSNPFSSTDYGLYINASGELVFSSLGSATVLGSGGGGGSTPSWEAIFALDSTFSKATAWTINNSSGNAEVLKLTNSGGGSGATLLIDNAGTGNDITGTAVWSVAKTGAAVFLSVTTATVNSSSNLTLSADGAGLVTIGANTNTITMAKATTFSSTITVTDGLTDLISTSNAAAALRITNNTATTLGAAVANLGVAVIRSTSLTTGSLLHLQLTEGTLTTGNYITAWDVTGSSVVFEVAKAGATTIGGVGGSTVFTITAGDAVLSDGSLSITDADNANSFVVVNNTITTGDLVSVASTSISTGALMKLNANTDAHDGEVLEIISSGDTTSTPVGVSVVIAEPTTGAARGLDITMVGATTGPIGIKLTMDAITESSMVYLDNGGGTLTTGYYINCNDDGAVLFGVGASGATTIAGLAGSTVFTVTAGDLVVSDGSLALTDADNAETVTIINNTATTIGAAASAGIVQVESTSLTTGAAVNVQLTEGTLNGGFYYSAWDATAGARVFSVGEDGATVIAGASAGNNALTVTAGDVRLTSGHLILTSGNATLTSGNLILTSGTLTMTSGSATITAGNLILTAGTIIETPQAIINANTAISVTHGVTTIANNAPSTHTLADGVAGQKKTIVCTVYTGDAVITPTNLANGTTITLNAVGDACDIVFLGTEWWVTNLYGTAALA